MLKRDNNTWCQQADLKKKWSWMWRWTRIRWQTMWLDSGALRRHKKKCSWRWMWTRMWTRIRWQTMPVGHSGIKTGGVDSKEARRSHFVVTPWVGPPSTSVLEATDIHQNVSQSPFLTPIDHFHFHPTLKLKSRVILTEKLSYQSSSPCCAD